VLYPQLATPPGVFFSLVTSMTPHLRGEGSPKSTIYWQVRSPIVYRRPCSLSTPHHPPETFVLVRFPDLAARTENGEVVSVLPSKSLFLFPETRGWRMTFSAFDSFRQLPRSSAVWLLSPPPQRFTGISEDYYFTIFKGAPSFLKLSLLLRTTKTLSQTKFEVFSFLFLVIDFCLASTEPQSLAEGLQVLFWYASLNPSSIQLSLPGRFQCGYRCSLLDSADHLEWF